ncbi:site-specific integrase [Pseudoalteromonas neustonica]|uniref:Site-specific integrase n=1 Tax=Pseudoalteromonas neustonica TaxID=1840331 RepID=A0ABU9U7S8_9GAMM
MEHILNKLFKNGIVTPEMTQEEASVNLAIAIISKTGIRLNELLKAHMGLIDSNSGRNINLVITTSEKTAQQERKIILSPLLSNALTIYQSRFHTQSIKNKTIFYSSKTGNPISPKVFNNYINLNKNVLYQGLTFNDFRKYALKNMFERCENFNPKTSIKRYMGHGNFQSTTKYIKK